MRHTSNNTTAHHDIVTDLCAPGASIITKGGKLAAEQMDRGATGYAMDWAPGERTEGGSEGAWGRKERSKGEKDPRIGDGRLSLAGWGWGRVQGAAMGETLDGEGREIHGTQGSWSGRREIETPRGRSLASIEPLGWRSEEHRGEALAGREQARDASRGAGERRWRRRGR
jgi:hypothetical protein